MNKRILVTVVAGAVLSLYLFNASWRVTAEPASVGLIAHRGVHQTYHRRDLTNETCTAERIDVPRHGYIENTIPSMAAAFDAGADVVELDIHPTTDGNLAVIHDWTLECRTNGTGVTRNRSLAYLKSLDIGYGYTDDGGITFPLRGKGIGLMPDLSQVFAAFPGKQFLVNFKSGHAKEADLLAELVSKKPEWRQRVWGVYGGGKPTWRAAELLGDGTPAFTRSSVKRCFVGYMALGWTGYMPESCHNTVLLVPVDLARWLWGWPNLLTQRLRDVGSEIALLGPLDADRKGAPGIDTLEHLALVPDDFSGYLWTDKIEVIGPAIRQRSRRETRW